MTRIMASSVTNVFNGVGWQWSSNGAGGTLSPGQIALSASAYRFSAPISVWDTNRVYIDISAINAGTSQMLIEFSWQGQSNGTWYPITVLSPGAVTGSFYPGTLLTESFLHYTPRAQVLDIPEGLYHLAIEAEGLYMRYGFLAGAAVNGAYIQTVTTVKG